MSTQASYDPIAEEYAKFAADHNDPSTVVGIATQALLSVLEGSVGMLDGQRICDLGCGEGHLSRRLASVGVQVVGIDISKRLLDIATSRTDTDNITYIHDDAQVLETIPDRSFDAVVSNLALMDIPDLGATYKSVKRVLKEEGFFVFSMTHPCFQTPHTEILCNDSGSIVGRIISDYAVEGFWRSDNPTGIRGKVGAVHRTLATYINTLVDHDFNLCHMEEPTLPVVDYSSIGQEIQMSIPSVLILSARLSPVEQHP